MAKNQAIAIYIALDKMLHMGKKAYLTISSERF